MDQVSARQADRSAPVCRSHASRFMAFFGIVLLSLALAGCQSTTNGAQRVTSGPVAFEVAGRAVSMAEVQRRVDSQLEAGVKQLLEQGQTREQITTLAQNQNVLQTLLDQIIQEELMIHEAHRLGVGIDPKVIDTQAGQPQQAQQDPGAPDSNQLLTRRINTARQQMVFAVILNQVRIDQFKSRHILVETEAEANQIVEQLKNGADFATLAREHSKDPGSAANGGEFDWMPRGSFVPEYEQVAFDENTPLNTPVIVKSQYGYHVIEILGRKLQQPFSSFEELSRSQNAQQLFNDQFLPWYTKYRQDAETNGTLKLLIQPNQLSLPFPPGTP